MHSSSNISGELLYLQIPNQILLKMQQNKRENVSELLRSNVTTVNDIEKRCGVSLKTVYNVGTKLSKSQSLKHHKEAGRPMKM